MLGEYDNPRGHYKEEDSHRCQLEFDILDQTHNGERENHGGRDLGLSASVSDGIISTHNVTKREHNV
jgi:hypothetical protein